MKKNFLTLRITQKLLMRSSQKLKTCDPKCLSMIFLSLKKIYPLTLEKEDEEKFLKIENNTKTTHSVLTKIRHVQAQTCTHNFSMFEGNSSINIGERG